VIVRPHRLPLPAALGVALIAFGLIFRDGRALAVATPFLLYSAAWLLGAMLTPRLRLETLRTVRPQRATTDEEAEITLSFVNRGPSLPYLAVRDDLPPGTARTAGENGALVPFPAGADGELHYRLAAPRGAHRLRRLLVTSWGWLPLYPTTDVIEDESDLLVLPTASALPSLSIRPRRTLVYSGIVKASTGGPGVEFFGCREYEPGDDMRRINWRAFARHGQLIVNEFEQERIADVNVILDARAGVHRNSGPIASFDASVHAAATMAGHFLDRGNYVGLLIYGDTLDWTYPGFGRPQKARILDALARAKTREKPAFDDLRNLPTRLFPSGSQLIVVSPLSDHGDIRVMGTLRARGYHVMLVSPNTLIQEREHWKAETRGSAEAWDRAERILSLRRGILLRALMRLGITVVDWEIGRTLEEAATPVALWLRKRGAS
jgi:uncharacterized protein (DUF58 family)